MPDPLRFGFAGDVMLGRLVNEAHQSRPPHAVWGDLREDLRDLDGFFVNLECCLSTRGERWTSTYRPFHFRADPEWAIPALEDVGVDYCSLANNHVLDYGRVALEDTLDALDGAGTARAGAGRTLDEARRPAVVECGPLTVAVISFTDNTPEYAATPEDPGTAHVEFDPGDEESMAVLDDAVTAAAAADPDLLVASLHWGPNMRTEPPEEFRRVARRLASLGVDVVHGHSAHVFQGVDVLDESRSPTLVCYDTGNFVDDYAIDPDLRNDRSFLFDLGVDADGSLRDLRLHPTEIDDRAVYHAPEHVAEWCRERMRSLSELFGTEFDREGDGLRLDMA